MRYVAVLLAFVAFPSPGFAQSDALTDLEMPCGHLCVDGEMLNTRTEAPPDTALIKQIYAGALPELCAWAIGGGPAMYEPEIYDLTYHPSWDEADAPERGLRLYRFFCNAGAYNEQHVYFVWTSDTGVELATFPQPTYRVDYVDGDTDGAFEAIAVTGMSSRAPLVNSRFDPATGTVTELSCWRGLCDASSAGQWVLDGGAFRLVSYDLDPTYDGAMNQFRLVDFSASKAVDTSVPLPPPEMPFDDVDDTAED